MDDLRERLAHVLWIGGGPHAGKTTLSRLLAGKYDLKIYNLDWHHDRDHRRRAGSKPGDRDESMDERWLHPAPDALARRDIASWTALSGPVIEDLLGLPTGRPIVAEGPTAFPWWVAPLLREARQAIWLLPTREVHDAVLARRYRDDPSGSSAAKTSDPVRAGRKIVERNELMAARIAASCEQLGLRSVRVDGSLDLDDTLALIEEHFRPHLPIMPNV